MQQGVIKSTFVEADLRRVPPVALSGQQWTTIQWTYAVDILDNFALTEEPFDWQAADWTRFVVRGDA